MDYDEKGRRDKQCVITLRVCRVTHMDIWTMTQTSIGACSEWYRATYHWFEGKMNGMLEQVDRHVGHVRPIGMR